MMAFIICVGLNACSLATTQSCSVALGDNVQFPSGVAGDHVLVTQDHVEPLVELTAALVERISRELRRVGSTSVLDDGYVKDWNKHCASAVTS